MRSHRQTGDRLQESAHFAKACAQVAQLRRELAAAQDDEHLSARAAELHKALGRGADRGDVGPAARSLQRHSGRGSAAWGHGRCDASTKRLPGIGARSCSPAPQSTVSPASPKELISSATVEMAWMEEPGRIGGDASGRSCDTLHRRALRGPSWHTMYRL